MGSIPTAYTMNTSKGFETSVQADSLKDGAASILDVGDRFRLAWNSVTENPVRYDRQ